MKSARNIQYLASDAVRWQEDKYALQQKQLRTDKKITDLRTLAGWTANLRLQNIFNFTFTDFAEITDLRTLAG